MTAPKTDQARPEAPLATTEETALTNASEAVGADSKAQASASASAEQTCGEDTEPDDKQLRMARMLLEEVANGRVPFDLRAGNEPIKACSYAYALATVLADTLGTNRKRVLLLALCYYARALTSAPVSTQNDLTLLLRGLQFTVQDLNFEVAETTALYLAISDQEAIAGRA